MPYCMNMWSLCMLLMDLFLFSGFNRFMHFLSTYAYSWINLRARRTLFDSAWYRVGLGGRCKPGMALTTIGEAPQWGWVADWSSCLTVAKLWTFASCSPSYLFYGRRQEYHRHSVFGAYNYYLLHTLLTKTVKQCTIMESRSLREYFVGNLGGKTLIY